MKIASWNVNGLRACLNKGFLDAFSKLEPDIFCLQEIKMERGQAEIDLTGYQEIWHSAEKKGYSGTAMFSKTAPDGFTFGMGIEEHDHEGRMITADFGEFYLINVYVPNSQRQLTRLDYRIRWEDDFRKYVTTLDKVKPVIICGDLNCAHKEIDLKNPKSNVRNAGFTQEERDKMTQLLGAGFTDFFRFLYPDKHDAYTWWSYMQDARNRNIGWRIDYFLGSDRLRNRVIDTPIYPEILGSDHCPIGLTMT